MFTKYIRINNFLFTGLISFIICNTGCKKAVEVNSLTDQLLASQVFASADNANTAIAGIYRTFRDDFSGSDFNPTILTGLSADELYNFFPDPIWDDYAQNHIQATNSQLPWTIFYNVIYQTNLAVEGLQNSGLPTTEKDHYIGEAKFIRAYSYFYLVNLFGEVPLLTSTNVSQNAKAARASIPVVYNQIVQDLTDAGNLLDKDYSFTGGQHTRADKWVALALLARIYLYQKDWANAENLASHVIDSGNYSLLTDLDSFAIQNNPEAILQLANNANDGNLEASSFIFTTSPSLLCTNSLLSAFEPGDQRRNKWIDSAVYQGSVYYFPIKYKVVGSGGNEYYTILRLSEQYLIRAEARANQNNMSGAQSDVNTLRNRAGLGNILVNDKPTMLFAIEQERRIELFAETGHRWFDLKRTGRVNEVMSAEKSVWKPENALYPLPLSDIQIDPSLSQNPGY